METKRKLPDAEEQQIEDSLAVPENATTEKSNPTSRFGRLLKKNVTMNRDSWIDITPSPDEIIETSVRKRVPTSKIKTGPKSKRVAKENPKKSVKADRAAAAIAATSSVEKSPVKKVVQNPFKINGAGDRTNDKEVGQAKPKALLDELTLNPKTIKQRKTNAEILNDFNKDHEDDIFGGLGDSGDKGADRLCGVLGNLNDSDCENDISLHSSRTPVSNYLGPASRPMLAVTKTPALPTDTLLNTE